MRRREPRSGHSIQFCPTSLLSLSSFSWCSLSILLRHPSYCLAVLSVSTSKGFEISQLLRKTEVRVGYMSASSFLSHGMQISPPCIASREELDIAAAAAAEGMRRGRLGKSVSWEISLPLYVVCVAAWVVQPANWRRVWRGRGKGASSWVSFSRVKNSTCSSLPSTVLSDECLCITYEEKCLR